MSDRCMIGFAHSDNTITAVYCHWNGDPKDAGTILMKNYNSSEKIKPLINAGFLSFIGDSIEESLPMSPATPAQTIADLQQFKSLAARMDVSFLYLFAENEWIFSTPYGDDWEKLADILKKWK